MPGNRKRAATVVHYLKTDIWRTHMTDLPPFKRFCVRQLRVALLTVDGFIKDRCGLRASALTFYTLLAVVPVAALAFGIANGFGFRAVLENELLQRFPGQEQVVYRIIAFADQTLETAKGGLIAGVGIAVLLYTVLKVLSNIEEAFNRIWGVHVHRSLIRKFSDYLSMMFLAPILVLLSGSLTVFISAEVLAVSEHLQLLQYIGPAIYAGLKTLSTILLWVLFTLVYVLMPNTKVRLFSAIIGAVVAGSAYQGAQWTYVSFQVVTARYNAIYGSFAALPLFILWIQISWLIVLLGAELSYAHQHADIHEIAPEDADVSPRHHKLMALQIAHFVVHRFVDGKPPLDADEISLRLELPVRMVARNLEVLVAGGLIAPSRRKADGPTVYLPARPPDRFTITAVLDALEHYGERELAVPTTPELLRIIEILEKFDKRLQMSSENHSLADL